MNRVSPVQYVYVLQNTEGKTYTGCTSDLVRRLNEHNTGRSTYTKHHGPYTLVYYEACLNKDDAFHREEYLKSGSGRNYMKKRLKNYTEKGLTR